MKPFSFYTTIVVASLLFLLLPLLAISQMTDAKLYQNYPYNLHMVQAGYGLQTTNATVDNAITFPENDVDISISFAYLRYAYFFKAFNRTAGVQIVAPMAWIDADILGVEAKESGFGDMAVAIGTNIIGGKPVTFEAYLTQPKKLALGWSLYVTAPTGDYSSDRFINVSGNRWQIKPEIGLSVPVNKFDFELNASAKFFTENDEFPTPTIIFPPGEPGISKGSLKQDPFFGTTFHGVYNVKPFLWVSLDAVTRFGGETTTNDVAGDNTQSMFALGGTLQLTPGLHHQILVNYVGTVAGNDYAPVGGLFNLKYAYIFGANMDESYQRVMNSGN